eukprot:RCo053078
MQLRATATVHIGQQPHMWLWMLVLRLLLLSPCEMLPPVSPLSTGSPSPVPFVLPPLMPSLELDRVPAMRIVHHATRAKRLWLQQRGWPNSSGFAVPEYVACPGLRMAPPRNSSLRTSKHVYQYASLWTPGLPYVEFLVFVMYRINPPKAWGQALSEWPQPPLTCVFPSGRRTPAAVYALTNARQMTPWGRKWKKSRGVTTSVRLYCPIPENDTSVLQPKFEVDVLWGNVGYVFPLCRADTTHVVLTGCSQALWDLDRDVRVYPDFLEEWVAYHTAMKGYDRFQIYDLYGTASLQATQARLEPWLRWGNVSLVPRFCFGPLCGAVRRARRMLSGLGTLSHDHCIFTNQLRSRWVHIVHAPHMFIVTGPKYPTVPHYLAQFHPPDYAEISVRRQEVYGPRTAVNTSLLLSFTERMNFTFKLCCQAPVFNPLYILGNLQHNALAMASGDLQRNTLKMHFADPEDLLAWHYRDATTGLNKTMKNPRREFTLKDLTLINLHPRIRAELQRQRALLLHYQKRELTKPTPATPPVAGAESPAVQSVPSPAPFLGKPERTVLAV